MHPRLKQVLIILGKLVVLYLMARIILINAILLRTTLSGLLFVAEAFVHAAAILIIGTAIVAYKTKSRTPLLWAVFCIGFSSLYILEAGFYGYLGIFIAGLFLAASINYLYRNRITEPLLILLPLLSGSWLFLQLIYGPYMPIWIAMKTGYMSVSQGFSMGFSTHLFWVALMIAPLMLLYVLGKHYYTNIYSFLKKRMQKAQV